MGFFGGQAWEEKKDQEGSSAVGHEGPRKTGENDGGGEGKSDSNDGTGQAIKASRRTTGGPSGPAKEVILWQSNVLSMEVIAMEDRPESREGSVPSREGTQRMEQEARIWSFEVQITSI